jgi:large repetitive protein
MHSRPASILRLNVPLTAVLILTFAFLATPLLVDAAQRADTDADGLYDDDEAQIYSTDPYSNDTDGDGLGDGEEVYLGTSPTIPNEAPTRRDSDADGLYDDDEIGIYGTSPEAPDTDGDGVDDGEEVYLGTDPAGPPPAGPPPVDPPPVDPPAPVEECHIGIMGPECPDNDGDGLTNAEEAALGTNPDNADTDGDFCPDGEEIDYTDPTVFDPGMALVC